MDERTRLRPTPEQYREFADYLGEAHSWYKHLPLMGGRRFVVFVAPDAGLGRLAAALGCRSPEATAGYTLFIPLEGPEFTDEHPRLHYGWKTTAEYRRRFGHLDYMHRPDPAGPYARDAGPPVRLPAEIEGRCGFDLYPYVSGTFGEAVTWDVHAEALAQLRAGASHPARDEVLELAHLAEARQAAWNDLTDAERDWAVAHDCGDETPDPTDPSARMRGYLDLEGRVQFAADVLRMREVEKVRRALAELDDWLRAGGARSVSEGDAAR